MKTRICENRLTQLTENTHKTTVLMLLQFTQKNYKNIKYQPERMFVVNLNKRTRRIHRRHRTTLSPRHGNRLYFDDSIDLELLCEFRSPLPSFLALVLYHPGPERRETAQQQREETLT